METLTKNELRDRWEHVEELIEEESQECFDCCANVGQSFHNIHDTSLMRQLLYDFLYN